MWFYIQIGRRNVSKIIDFHATNYFVTKKKCARCCYVFPSYVLVSFFLAINMRKEKDNIGLINIRLKARS